ncbi:recD-like protein [Vibrio phage 496E54-1]|nr:recD-like protein [Vibrio phage 495E54-1]CAH9014883.1 recD-like protein [Vibrio phage 496E54-1]
MDEKLRLIVEGLDFTLTNEQQDFLVRFINGNGNWSLLGDAGVGKSTIMYILHLYYEDEIVFVASTGTASEELPHDIGSGTGHSLFNIARDQAIDSDWRKRPSDILTKTDLVKIIVLDEGYCYNSQDLAMIQHQINKVNKKSKNRTQREIRLLIVGDCLQRLPIVDNEYKEFLNEEYGSWLMFRSRLWKEMNFETYVLQEVKRQVGTEPKDIWFKKALYVMRYGITKHYPKIIEGFNRKFVGSNHSEDAVYLAPTNTKVNTYNDQYLARNPNLKITFTVKFDKKYTKKDFPMDWEVTLAEGCKFITLVNNPEAGWFNGTVLTATQVSSEGVYATKEDGEEVFVGIHEFKEEELYAAKEERHGVIRDVQKRKHVASAFMLPAKLCAGFTFSRAQGKSINQELVLDFGSDRDTWLYTKQGMEDFMVSGAFVGFSRATNIDHIKLRNPLRMEHLKVDTDSVNWWFECVRNMEGK